MAKSKVSRVHGKLNAFKRELFAYKLMFGVGKSRDWVWISVKVWSLANSITPSAFVRDCYLFPLLFRSAFVSTTLENALPLLRVNQCVHFVGLKCSGVCGIWELYSRFGFAVTVRQLVSEFLRTFFFYSSWEVILRTSYCLLPVSYSFVLLLWSPAFIVSLIYICKEFSIVFNDNS